jgi:hypothetical protein
MYRVIVNFYGHTNRITETENITLVKDLIKIARSNEWAENVAVEFTDQTCSIPETVYSQFRGVRGGWGKPFNELARVTNR